MFKLKKKAVVAKEDCESRNPSGKSDEANQEADLIPIPLDYLGIGAIVNLPK
jgi:hypothetical protein